MRILKDSAIYLIGELVAKFVPFLMLPYLSRKLGVEGFGELSYFQTFIALFSIFIGLSQDGAVARYFYRYGKRSLNLVVVTGYSYTVVIGIVSSIMCYFFKSEIMFYIILSVVFQVFLSVQLSIRQCQKQVVSYSLIQLGSVLTNVLFTVLALELFESDLVEKRILAVFVSNVFVSVTAYFIFLYRDEVNRRKFNFHQYKSALLFLLSFGVPLIFHIGSGYLKGNADRLLIHEVYGNATLGLYAMGLNIALILTSIIIAANKAILPYYFEGIKNQSITKNKVFYWTLLSFVLVPIPMLVCLLLPNSVFVLFLGNGFDGVKYFISVFLLAKALSIPYLFMANYLFYYGKTKQVALCSVFSMIIYVAMLFLLSDMDIEYIPFANVFSELAILPILYFMVKKEKV